MIKINKVSCPTELNDEVRQQLTDTYIQSGTSVWKQKYIVEALLDSSHSKCCYCECNVSEESKYMEVEHFMDKNHYPDKVVEWDNLLPSCKRCNGNKSDHDVVSEPIINPAIIEPKEHLTMWAYRFRSKNGSVIGQNTIDVIQLNETHRLGLARFEIGEETHNQINILLDLTVEYCDGTAQHTRRRNKIKSQIKALMREGCPTQEYSATVATEINNSEEFSVVMDLFKGNDLWDEEMDELYSEVCKSALEISIR
ncbi:hypothetical protein AVT_11230 [Bacillus tropicus]|uniref:HNH endonuclease n=1 Tax=Bacillus shihchuchen TaxID=3036942 RepID=A0ABT7KXS7_9BACI|nr:MULTISPECIES: hypothetical protein [Bacillus cereus group]MDA1782494.1 hypothetical protein [Bacillus cereus]MDL2418956.1 hypothetical protein [Bacillus shihchuchen]MDZ4536078.1 hypothetical protein [Bacillus cereus]WBO92463.1 hypothetical protein AVT_11230 [Bacillus tropicus]